MIYLDTHVAVWLASGETARLSRRAARLIDQEQLVISPIVLLEMELLKEIGRIRVPADTIYELLQREIGLTTCRHDFISIIKAALSRKWTRDPFDRIIVAQAALSGERLLSKDENILSRYPKALWE
jgi:PIN domain nuclease of toxin-antitoxin system